MVKFDVTFVVRNEHGGVAHRWSAVYNAENFGDAEKKALRTLEENGDKESKIERIELW